MHHQNVRIWVQIVTMNLFLLQKGVIYGQKEDYSIDFTGYVTVREGLCVTIPCKFTANYKNTFKSSSSIWRDTFKNNVTYSDKSRNGTKPNFYVLGNPDIGDCTLTITDARKDDAGFYHFRFEQSEKSKIKYSYNLKKTLYVSVTALTDKPQIILNGELNPGKEANLMCVPPGNCTGTPPNFQWMKSDHKGIWRSSANVTFTPSKSDNQTSVTCTVTFQPGNKVTSNPTILDVRAPYPSITITTADNTTVNGSFSVNGKEPVTLTCQAESYPEADITWYKGNNIVNKSKSAATVHIDVTSNTTYVCLAWNEKGIDLKFVNIFLWDPNPTSESFFTDSNTTSHSFLTDSNPTSQRFLTDSNPISQRFLAETTVRDMFIGVAIGFIICLIVLLLFKFFFGNKPTSTSDLHEPQGFPSSQDVPLKHEIYEQVSEPKSQGSNAPENANEPSDENDVNYTTIKFSKVEAKVTPKESECEYSEIKFS